MKFLTGVQALAVSCTLMLGLLTIDINKKTTTYISSTLQLPNIITTPTNKTLTNQFSERLVKGFGVKPEVASEFSGWILEASERQKIHPDILASLLITESSFRKHVVSHVGAVGPAQVRPEYWAKYCGVSEALLSDPEANIQCGAMVLAYFKDRCLGSLQCALRAYNVGLHSQRIKAAQRYVNKIKKYLSSLLCYPRYYSENHPPHSTPVRLKDHQIPQCISTLL
tara:strand:- start:262 stop:936 length:675 start_codon:yes stop_codon:yes gene_type:complete